LSRKHRILLVNPPIHDFAAYNFWLRPYGLLTVAGQLRGQAECLFFDYLDRLKCDPQSSDEWGRGPFSCERLCNPAPLKDIPRYFRRFGHPRSGFQEYLRRHGPLDYALVQTVMTYWYPGVAEVIEDVRHACPGTGIVLGGNYATLCTEHARRLGADLVVAGSDLQPLWQLLGVTPDLDQPALWEVYELVHVGALRLSDGCPFRCSYCSVPKVYAGFRPRPLGRALGELEFLVECGAENVAFYDDALLCDAEKVLVRMA